MRMNSNVHKFEQKGELNWILKKLFLSSTEYRVCQRERARLWHMFPFSSSTPQLTARCRGLSRVQCSPFSTNHSTERNAVRDLTEREILLKKISTYEFAALDLQIYLDTHPHDTARGGLLMFVYEKKLQYPVNIKKPNAKLAKIIITQYGGA